MSEVIEQRLSPRYPAGVHQVIIGLTKRHHVCGSLVNISRTGALLGTEEKPALHSTIRVRLQYPIPSPWVEATVVRAPANGGVGIAFKHRAIRRCSMARSKAMTFGWPPITSFMRPRWIYRGKTRRSQDWRVRSKDEGVSRLAQLASSG